MCDKTRGCRKQFVKNVENRSPEYFCFQKWKRKMTFLSIIPEYLVSNGEMVKSEKKPTNFYVFISGFGASWRLDELLKMFHIWVSKKTKKSDLEHVFLIWLQKYIFFHFFSTFLWPKSCSGKKWSKKWVRASTTKLGKNGDISKKKCRKKNLRFWKKKCDISHEGV